MLSPRLWHLTSRGFIFDFHYILFPSSLVLFLSVDIQLDFLTYWKEANCSAGYTDAVFIYTVTLPTNCSSYIDILNHHHYNTNWLSREISMVSKWKCGLFWGKTYSFVNIGHLHTTFYSYLYYKFSWQQVVRLPKIWILKWTNNQKLDSFIQTYQAPLNDRHRYWTGLLLLERVLLTYISILLQMLTPMLLLLSIICSLGFLLLLRLTYTKNLYKKMVSGFAWNCADLFVFTLAVYIFEDVSVKRIFAYISITFVLLLLLIVIACHIYVYILVGAFPKLKT